MTSTKKHFLLKPLSIFLAVLLLIGAMGPLTAYTSHAAAPSSYTSISSNSSAYVNLSSGGEKYFKFVPTASGTYKFYSTNNSGDPYGALLDALGNTLISDDDDVDRNFSFTFECTANTTYYIKAFMYGSGTGSYTLNVQTVSVSSPSVPSTPSGSSLNVNASGSYHLFNSGATSSSGYAYSTSGEGSNPDCRSYTNSGYDIYGDSPSSNDLTRGLGLSFLVSSEVTERATLTIYAYDIDEESSQIDDIYLVNDSTGERVFIGNLSGRNETWSTTTLTIDANKFVVGQTYHFEVDICMGGWWTWVRRVSLEMTTGQYIPTTITDHSFSATIDNNGRVNTNLSVTTTTDAVYYLEYTATIQGMQKGGAEGSTISATTAGASKTVSFDLESGAPVGTYEIRVVLKDSLGNTITSYTTTAGYSYSAVSYDANGGSNNLPIDATAYSSGDTVTVKFDYIPSRSGYTFLGWSTDASATVPTYTSAGTNTFTIGSSDVTLYAVWEEVEEPPVNPPVNPPVADTWDGTVDTSWYSSPYTIFTIHTAEQLAGLAQLVNNGNSFSGVTIILASNIDLAGLEWTPIGKGVCTNDTYTSSYAFSGTFDGRGHIIYNMLISSSSTSFTGFFGCLNDATIANLGIENASVNANGISSFRCTAGILAGASCNGTTATLVGVTGELTVNGNTSYLDIGALIGDCYGTTVTNSYATADVTVSSGSGGHVGGLFGFLDSSSSVTNLLYIGNISRGNADHWGAIHSGSGGGDTYSCYYNSNAMSSGSVSVPTASLLDQSIFTAFDFVDTWEMGDSHPILQGFDRGSSVHTHSFIESSRTDADCTSYGEITYTCSCGATKTELIAPWMHDYQITDSRDATCTTDGYIEFTCQNPGCGATKRQIIERYGHDYNGGNVCNNCGHTIEIHTHSYDINTVAPTCTTMGYTEYTCSCGHSYRDAYVEPSRHNWSDGEITIEATCTDEGLMTYTCQDCGTTKTAIIEAGHDWSETVAVEKTCTTNGSVSKTCQTCGLTETEIIPAGHDWDEGTEILAPTCKTEGSRSCTCSACGATEVFVISPLGHSYVNGVCTRCHSKFIDDITPSTHPLYGMYFEIDDILSDYGPSLIDEYGLMLDYNSGATLEKVAVYLTQDGTMWRRCIAVKGTNIQYATYVPYLSYKSEIKYTGLNHDWINVFNLKENANGIWCYNNYATIGVNLQDAYGNLLLSLYDIGQAGAETRIFDDLDEMIAWLNEDSSCIYHQPDEWIIDTEPTCTESGSKHAQCTSCGIDMEEVIPALGHTETNWIIDAEATITAPGSMHKECTVCGEITATESIPFSTVIKVHGVTTAPGAIVSVAISIKNNPGISSGALTLTVDPSLELLNFHRHLALGTLDFNDTGDSELYRFNWEGTEDDTTNGTMIILTFKVPDNATVGTVYNFDISFDGEFRNASGETVDIILEDGSITISEIDGDLNDDGFVDVADIVVLRRYIAGTYGVTLDEDKADINNDGVIDESDVDDLRNYISNN